MPATNSSKTKHRGHVLRDEPYEDITWNQRRFPKSALFRHLASINFAGATLDKPGFLHTRGNYGWLLIGPVAHDGDLYLRPCPRRGRVFGSASALRELGMPDAQILGPREVIALALRQALYLRLRNHATHRLLDVAMLHPWISPGAPRTCGVFLDEAGVLTPINPEEPAPYNTPEARYSIISPLTDGVLSANLRSLLDSAPGSDSHARCP